MTHNKAVIIAFVELIIMSPFFPLGFVFELVACGFGAGREASRKLALRAERARKNESPSAPTG